MKDDYVGDVMAIAAGAMGILQVVKGGTNVPDPPDIEDETVEALDRQEMFHMLADLFKAETGKTEVDAALAAWKEEIARQGKENDDQFAVCAGRDR
jgi:hypothetical protein